MIIKKERINELSERTYALHEKNGGHARHISDDEYLMLITSGIAKAERAARQGKEGDPDFLFYMRKRLPRDKGFRILYESYVYGTIQDELADIIIRCCDYLGSRGLKFNLGYGPVFRDPFYTTFAEGAWQWVGILADTSHKVEDRICELIFEVLDYCDMRCFDIEKLIEMKLEHNFITMIND